MYNRETLNYRATLVAGDQQPALRVEAYEHYLNVEPVQVAPLQAGRSLELWAIPADGILVSLGVVPSDSKGRVELSEAHRKLMGSAINLATLLEAQAVHCPDRCCIKASWLRCKGSIPSSSAR